MLTMVNVCRVVVGCWVLFDRAAGVRRKEKKFVSVCREMNLWCVGFGRIQCRADNSRSPSVSGRPQSGLAQVPLQAVRTDIDGGMDLMHLIVAARWLGDWVDSISY